MNYKIILLLIFVLIIKTFSSSLYESRGISSGPLTLINNPSFISLQTGIPFGTEFSYDIENREKSIFSGMIRKYDNSAFSFCFLRDFDYNLNNIFIGASSFNDYASGGMSFNIINRRETVELTFDIGTTVFINDIVNISAALKNVFFYDKEDDDYSPELIMSTGGYIRNYDNIFYNIFIFNKFIDVTKREFSFGGGCSSQLYFFNNPSLDIYIKSYAERDKNSQVYPFAELSAGTHFKIQRSKTGFSAGILSDIKRKINKIVFSLFYNPLSVKKTELQNIKMDITPDKINFSPDGDGLNDRLYVKIDYSNKSGRNIEKWAIMISKFDNGVMKLVKTISGGGTPPASIFWDGRDDSDNILEENTYIIKAAVVDNYGNKHNSSEKRVNLIRE